MMPLPLNFSSAVAAAKAEARPLVALESTIITHGTVSYTHLTLPTTPYV